MTDCSQRPPAVASRPWRRAHLRRVLGLGLLLALGACESMTEDQCRSANWLERGRSDGRRGEADSYIDAHRQACAKAHIVPDARLWHQGWAEGVRSYCTPTVAWQRGLENRSYYGACRDLDEAGFLRWHRAGKDAYDTRQERDKRRRDIDEAEAALKKADTDEQRQALRRRIRQLDVEEGRLRRLLEAQMNGAPR
jgi:hypothetical protein